MAVKCVVPLSGGKDSQLCMELALQHFSLDEILCLFCDTGYEHPLTYQHIDWMEHYYNVQVVRLHSEYTAVYDLVYKTGCFPTDIMRFCTNELKIKRSKYFYSVLARLQGTGFEVWYGMRLGESHARSERYSQHNASSVYEPQEIMSNYPKYLGKLGVRFKLPILTLDESDVYTALGGRKNPLYDLGFDRVGCFPCLAGGDRFKERAFNLDAVGQARKIEVLDISRVIGKNIFNTKGVLLRNPLYDVQGKLQSKFNLPNAPIINDDVAPCHICNI